MLSHTRNLPVHAFQLALHQRVLVYDDLRALEFQDHERWNHVDFEGSIRSSHRSRVDEMNAVVLRGLQIVRVARDEQIDSQLLGFVFKSLLVRPGNDLMSMDHTNLDPAELEHLSNDQLTFSSGKSARASSSQSPLTTWKVGASDLAQSKTSRDPMFPVQKTALTLLGVIISLYLGGISAQRSGIWKSPRTRASWPIYSSSDMLRNKSNIA